MNEKMLMVVAAKASEVSKLYVDLQVEYKRMAEEATETLNKLATHRNAILHVGARFAKLPAMEAEYQKSYNDLGNLLDAFDLEDQMEAIIARPYAWAAQQLNDN